jgi:ABC-type Co2+ transport system permease subunit
MTIDFWGAICFGLVVGWITYRTLRRSADKVGLGDIATVIGAVGGAAVTSLFAKDLFAGYAIGLAVGFFLYFIIGLILEGKKGVVVWMGDKPKKGNKPDDE